MAETRKERTRARVVQALRLGNRTVDELAGELGVTDNAIRAHLAALESGSVVEQVGVRRSGSAGKPAVIYGIVAEAEVAFSRIYAPMLGTLVESLGERLSSAELEAVFREVGRRLATGFSAPSGPLGKRVRAVSVVLNELGALTTVESKNGHALLRGASCPLAVAVDRRKEVCCAVEELLTVLIGADVERQCMYDGHPACRFALSERSDE